MSEAKGMLKTCDRCGQTVFLKAIADGVTDGGYTRWNRFEDAPEGWGYRKETGTLCPKCNEEYNNLVKWFMDRRDYINLNTTAPEATLNGGVDGYLVERYVPVQPSDASYERFKDIH